MNSTNLAGEYVQRWMGVSQRVEGMVEGMEMLPRLQEKIDKLW